MTRLAAVVDPEADRGSRSHPGVRRRVGRVSRSMGGVGTFSRANTIRGIRQVIAVRVDLEIARDSRGLKVRLATPDGDRRVAGSSAPKA